MTEEHGAAGEAAEEVRASEATEAEADAGQSELQTLREQAEDNWNKYLRTVAELENLRKRNAREVENARRYGAEQLVAALLPVRDSLEAGLKAATETDAEAVEIEVLLEGERATLKLMDTALESAGIREIDPEGEPFNPELHEAMSLLPSATAEPNSVIAVVQKGYALNDRVIRPARVVVAQAPPDSAE